MDYEVKDWLSNPVEPVHEQLLTRLNDWQKACETNHQFSSLCRVYLLRARVSLASLQFGEVEHWLDLCLKTAELQGLKIYQDISKKEMEIFSSHKQRIAPLLEKETALAPKEQEKKLQEYIKKALSSMEKGELR